MSSWTTALEATALATGLRQSVWAYPLVNAGHILGLALLVGSVVAMDLRVIRTGALGARAELRGLAATGFALAAICGTLLFVIQASDYLRSPWFLAKAGLIVLAALNALLFYTQGTEKTPRLRATASLCLWIAALICGRMIGYR